MARQIVKCPGCNTKLQIPAFDPSATTSYANGKIPTEGKPPRNVWKEQDPTNPNAGLSFGIGIGFTLVWFAIIYFFQAPPGKASSEFTTGEVLANLFYKHFTVSFANTLFFFWAAAICYLKLLKLRHQRRAMLLDVLPRELGNTINAQNVERFIDHVYGLPVSLRDSLMVNRIRKALEFFEVRQNVADVSTLMASQSGIDGSRIIGSYIMPKAFLWAIPLLGFIGTVIGLSHAISGMSFSNVEDVSKIVGSINNVTSGLGTAFDATLLGLVFAVTLNFPLNSLSKHEEEALNDIDAYCNEVLLPRLDDGASTKKERSIDTPALESLSDVASAVVEALTGSQREFLTDLNTLSAEMLEYADQLQQRNEQYQQTALQHLAEHLQSIDSRTEEHFASLQKKNEAAIQSFADTIAKLESSSRAVTEAAQKGQVAALIQFSEKLESVTEGASKSLSNSLQLTEKTIAGFTDHIVKIGSLSEKYQETTKAAHLGAVESLSNRIGDISSTAEKSLKASLDLTHSTISSLESGVRELNSVLEKLGAKQVIIQQVQKKGWFSRG